VKFTERHIRYAILAGFFVMLLVSYKVAIKSTITTYSDYKELKEKSRVAEDLPIRIAELQEKLNDLNQTYFDAVKIIDNTHELFLDKLGQFASANRTTITEYPKEHIYETSSVLIETHSAILTGRFINLLKVLYQLEVKERIGRIVSVEFFTETNRRTKVSSLYMRLYIQNYRNLNRNEENQ
jgi:hypothetical protein